MASKRKAQQAGLDIAVGITPTLRRSSRTAALKAKADSQPEAKRPRGRPPKNDISSLVPANKDVAKQIGLSSKEPMKKTTSRNACFDEGSRDIAAAKNLPETPVKKAPTQNGLAYSVDSGLKASVEEDSDAEEPVEEVSKAGGATVALPSPYKEYEDILSHEIVVFMFSKAFEFAVMDQALECPRKHGVTPEIAIQEFRRFLAIKTWTVDIDATKISGSPIMDHMWHAAVLDTEFYANLQTVLGFKLRHNPKGATDEDEKNREKRLANMTTLYTLFFSDSGPNREPYRSNPCIRTNINEPTFQIFVKDLVGGTIKGLEGRTSIKVHSTDLVRELKEIIKRKVIPVPIGLQRLIFAGTELENSLTLEHYHIKEEYTVLLKLHRC